MIDLAQSMLWTTCDGDVKLEKGLEILKYVIMKTIQTKSGYNPNVIINVFCFKSSKLTVIIKGWELTSENVDSFLKLIMQEIYKNLSMENDKSNNNFFNILREGVISLKLFKNDNKSFSNLLVITDANYPIPDGMFLDKLISLLRFCSVACSFIYIKSENDVGNFFSIIDQGNGDQLKLIANVTGGFYATSKDFGLLNDKYILSYQCFDQSEYIYLDSIILRHFNERDCNISPLHMILSFINAGYFLNSINILRDSRCEIELQLPWRSDIYFRANISTKYPIDQYKKCKLTICICANSYFLQFISKMPSNTDLVDVNNQRFSIFFSETKNYVYYMESFSQFHQKPICTIPNFINNGLKPMLSPTNQPCDKIDKIPKKFFEFWKRTLDLEYLTCLHTTKIHLILEHDYPFPEYLSTPDPISNKYSTIQCREGLVQLSTLINKNFCSFIVKDSSTYVKFFTDSCNPNHFCVIKLIVKDFEATLLLYFFIHTPEFIRDEFVTNLTNAINNLKFLPRGKQARPRHMSSQMTKTMDHVPPQQRSWEQINCCIILNLDLDNLIATYNPIKSVDGNSKRVIRYNQLSQSMVYLHHQCYHEYSVWSINQTFVNNIFQMLIKIRLQEGFHFAYSDSTSGFINLVKEIKLLNNNNNVYHCFIQYMIYLDHNRSRHDSDVSYVTEDAYTTISDRYPSGVCKIFTEILIERKLGTVTDCDPEIEHWRGLTYKEVPKEIIDLDQKCVETFVTFECFQIYPATLGRGFVKPNICSVLNNSSRFVLNCPLYSDNTMENFKNLNAIFFDTLDRNLKLNGFSNIDITKTENANFNNLLTSSNQCPFDPSGIIWHCYYTMTGQLLIVLMLPSNYLDIDINLNTMGQLPLYVYGMSLKHLSFLIEDRWTLKLPADQVLILPLADKQFLLAHQSDLERNNEFGHEIDTIQQYLYEKIDKLNHVYILTFVSGVHRNLRENRAVSHANLLTVFTEYCRQLSCYDVDATAFMNAICSHTQSPVLPSSIFLATASTNVIMNKDSCELKTGMHNRIVKRIRSMMAKYFKEVPSFPQILIYCPENEIDALAIDTAVIDTPISMTVADGNDNMVPNDDLSAFHRQLSQDPSFTDLDASSFTDNLSELDTKSICSMANINHNKHCPLFISINYALKYDGRDRNLNFDSVPTCVSDFIDEIRSIASGDIHFEKLRLHFDMIPITVIDDDNTDLSSSKLKTANSSLTVEGKVSMRKKPSDITRKYLSSMQTQLLNNCRNELVWTLDDEIVNCLKYQTPIDQHKIETVMKHIDGTLQHKWQKSYALQIRKRLFELKFVFGFEKSKGLFQERFEKILFGKCAQYKIEKIGGIYCIFKKIKNNDDNSTLPFGTYADQTLTDMDDVFSQSRMRYATMCLNKTNDDLDMPIRRASSEGKLNLRNYYRKMSADPHERRSFALCNSEKPNTRNATFIIKPTEFTPISNIITQNNPDTIIRQARSPMPYPLNSHTMSFTPRRHRSGEASSTIMAGNCRSDTPMMPNDLISTATSSKGYEGDSSRVSDGEDYDMIDHFSNSVEDNKIDNNKFEMAPFWLLFNINDCHGNIEVYFHHTDNCWLSVPNCNFPVCEHCACYESIFEKFDECVHQVNQCLLLKQLAQSRFCLQILVPQDETDLSQSSMSQFIDTDYMDEFIDSSTNFEPGVFACPKIIDISFRLHSRLRGPTDKNLKAIPLLRSGLENIAVLNRKNMLIFIDDHTKGIFYSIMGEKTRNLDQDEMDRLNENAVLISNNQFNHSMNKIEDMFQQKNAENIDTLSIKSAPLCSSSMGQTRSVELLELSVYGVDKLCDDTIRSIISNIGTKLDLIVLRKLSESICRTRSILLNKEDIDFLLSEDFHNKPQKPKTFAWSLPQLVIDNKLPFCYYLKQNLQVGFTCPKICDQLERFYFNAEGLCEIYIFNQPSAQGVSNEVIALFTLQLIDGSSQSPCVIKDCNLPEFQLTNETFVKNIIQNNHVLELGDIPMPNKGNDRCYLNFRLWMRGLIDEEVIKKKIINAIQYSLNNLFMEYVIIPCPISVFDDELMEQINLSATLEPEKLTELNTKIMAYENGDQGHLNTLFVDSLFDFIPELSKNDCPLFKYRRFEMLSDFNVEFLLHDLIKLMNDYLHLNAFQLDDGVWLPWSAQFPRSGKEFPGVKRSFVLIGRLEELWKLFITKRYGNSFERDDLSNSQTSLSFGSNNLSASINSTNSLNQVNSMKELRRLRGLLRQPPLENNSINLSNTQSNSNTSSTNSLNGMPEFCNVDVPMSTMIPRQMLCVVKIYGCYIDTINYNMGKDMTEHLYRAIEEILVVHKERFRMLNSFIYQKMGLFYDCSSKSCMQSINVNTVKSNLTIQSVKLKITSSNVGDLNRERKPSGSPRPFSPTSQISMKQLPNNPNKPASYKTAFNKTININLARIYQDAYSVYQLSEIKRSDTTNDIISQHAFQFMSTYQMEFKRRHLSKKIRQSINSLQPAIHFKQSEFNEVYSPLQQLDVFSCLKRACRIFHSVVCPILFIPNARKRFLDSSCSKQFESDDQSNETSPSDDWIQEMSRLILAHYADYVQKEHGFQFINPPRPNMSQKAGSYALFQKLSNNSGIHIIEVFILKDCLCVRLNLLEIRRLNSSIPGLTSSSANLTPIQQAQKSFIKDACKFCDLTHLMSFMYDVHVRMIAKSISYSEENKKSFNPISFLRDMVKIYEQPPLYATSHLYLMPFNVPNDIIKPDNLFEFLQRHYEDYDFSINNHFTGQSNSDNGPAFLYNILEESYLSPKLRETKKISPTSSSPLDRGSVDGGIYYKISDNFKEWSFTSIFCLTRSQEFPETYFDLFIITFNRATFFPHQRLAIVSSNDQKSSAILSSYLTILPHNSMNPANLIHTNPCPITLTRIDENNIPDTVAWRTYENRSIVPLQAPLFFNLRTCIEKYFRESNEKFSRAITDCHKDSLWHRMYQQSGNSDSKFTLAFEEFQDLVNSGDIVDILELDNRLIDSMKIAASHLKQLNDRMGDLSDDCYTVLYENTTSLCDSPRNNTSSHLVLMSKKTKDGFLLLSKNDDQNSNLDYYSVQLKAIFRAQDCRNRIPPQNKYFSSSLRDITVMLAETAAFCIWLKLAMKPLPSNK